MPLHANTNLQENNHVTGFDHMVVRLCAQLSENERNVNDIVNNVKKSFSVDVKKGQILKEVKTPSQNLSYSMGYLN